MPVLPSPAARLQRVALNPFAALNQRLQTIVAAGQDIIRLDIGSPDLPPPESVIEALSRSAADPTHHGYQNYRGDAAFRQAVAVYYQRRFGVTLDPETEVLPLLGSKEGLVNLTLTYVDHGDAVLIPSIAYPSYAAGARLAGGDLLTLPTPVENGYLPDFDTPIAGIERAKLLWLNYPNNPTGTVASLEIYERALAFCQTHNLLLCSDNPYADVTFDGYVAPSALQVPGVKEQGVEFMSLSKVYNMAGWRLGACVGNPEVLKRLLVVKSTADSAHFKPIYDAGTEALLHTSDDWITARNARYASRRDRLLAALPELGLAAESPRGAMYLWAKIMDGQPDHAYTESALEHTCVSITPGSTYGATGSHYVRFSLGIGEARLEEAIDRLRAWHNR